MPKRLAYPTVSRHFQFFAEDLAYLEANFGPRSRRGMAMNEIVRNLVHDAVKAARWAEEEAMERNVVLERARERGRGRVEPMSEADRIEQLINETNIQGWKP